MFTPLEPYRHVCKFAACTINCCIQATFLYQCKACNANYVSFVQVYAGVCRHMSACLVMEQVKSPILSFLLFPSLFGIYVVLQRFHICTPPELQIRIDHLDGIWANAESKRSTYRSTTCTRREGKRRLRWSRTASSSDCAGCEFIPTAIKSDCELSSPS